MTHVFQGGGLAARATFARNGSNLVVTLENISPCDVTCPEEVLTAVFFDLDGLDSDTLTPVSAVLSDGSHVLFPISGDGTASGQIGGEYGFWPDLGAGPSWMGQTVISAVGLGNLIGPKTLFPGPPLYSPDSPNGLAYGLVCSADDPNGGNAKVTGAVPLVQTGVTFTLAGLPEGYALADSVHNVAFNYGTDLSPIPAPGALVLGIIGMAMVGWRTCRRRPDLD